MPFSSSRRSAVPTDATTELEEADGTLSILRVTIR